MIAAFPFSRCGGSYPARMPLVVYAVSAALILFLARRCVAPIRARVLIAIALLPLAMTGRAMLTGRLIAPVEMPYMTEPLYAMKNAHGVGGMYNGVLFDIAWQMLPWRAAVRDAFMHREWPLLNRSILGGDLLASAAQPAAYSPITWISCLLPPAESFNVSASLTLLLAALGAFLFAAELGCGEGIALFAAIGWMLSTPISAFAMWPLGASWAPLPFLTAGGATLRTHALVSLGSVADDRAHARHAQRTSRVAAARSDFRRGVRRV